ncbi:hypothetical protein EHI8A_013020 [Entamoeba histolytica HM-1:IMSS-B]|uniref:Leucine-rich repeat containing protein n=6 Tax=Entamoeba histolytica TaxID=5759 RepID=C4LYN1_ENTH1|nr:hypothetical protein EHI_118830 [Entamoeba histolytica HM-1:IMSS]EMD48259.1 Hypothetical protein EHI5A_001970 [Entamoeba histolytica KU27]EMH76959.1 hypothetical protein EHI8A_013020 [Entamoeba histolytica HM-1:IMSS-B]EMS15025.1 hypothetical protein KM1_001130 [Entamoeba histolytica HM-3:IMSS]ENY63041.1 hypothetical protein EHI7A_016600 [Entamoeba histolytica HM-1:IMSS-A]GAT93938.1 hypothetical protein CL6EHI_118830 [Entamoeba histolytica]|eukprot:XP_654112.1 hypothetical protein EHI_118830 [Entamoeba histolytica HM-1:IMSS]
MAPLEKVYLANVLIFVDSLETVYKLMMVNSKCCDAVEILRINPLFSIKPPIGPKDFIYFEKEFQKELNLFPNIETLQLPCKLLKSHFPIPQGVKRIILVQPISSDREIEAIETIKDKVVELTIRSITNPIDLSEFKQLRCVRLLLQKQGKVSDFFKNKQKRVDFVHITMLSTIDFDFLQNSNKYNFGKTVVHLFNKEYLVKVVQIPKVFDRVTVCFNYWYSGIDSRIIVLPIGDSRIGVLINNKVDQFFINQYYPSKINIIDGDLTNTNQFVMDFSQCSSVVSLHSTTECYFIPPTGLLSLKSQQIFPQLIHLKRLHLYSFSNDIILPTTITKLVLNKTNGKVKNFSLCKVKRFSGKYCEVDGIYDCTTLTYLRLQGITFTQPLTRLTHLHEMSIKCIGITPSLDNFYPYSLQTLKCTIKHIPKFCGVSSLTIRSFISSVTSLDLSLYSNLHYLNLKQLPFNSIILPLNLQILELFSVVFKGRLDLSQYSSILSLSVYNTNSLKFELILPSSLQKLFIFSSKFTIPNLNDIPLKECSLNYSPLFDSTPINKSARIVIIN